MESLNDDLNKSTRRNGETSSNVHDDDDDDEELRMANYVYEKFKEDFHSRIWLTYRRDFSVLQRSSLNSDTGWGCMIRSGQMILAQALVQHFLGRDWIWKDSKPPDETNVLHRKIIKWFLDDLNSSQHPFSLHELVKIGHKMGKKPGDWFGPASISFVLK